MNLKFLFKKISEYLDKNLNREETVDPHELEMGIKEEMEHTDDPEIAKEIALDHLEEHPNYYTKLKEVFSTLNKKAQAYQITVNDKIYDIDITQEVDTTNENSVIKYYITFKEYPDMSFEIENAEEIPEPELKDIIVDYIVNFKDLAIKSYIEDQIPVDQSDFNYKDKRTDTEDYYDKLGQSLDKPKPDGESSMPVREKNKYPYPSTGWYSDMRGSSEPPSDYSDSNYSKAKEGDLRPDWATESKFSWIDKDELFKFMKLCKLFKINRELTRNATIYKYLPFFVKNSAYYRLLDAYLNILFEPVDNIININNSNKSIINLVDALYAKGYNKSTIKKEAYKEFEKEIYSDNNIKKEIKQYIKFKFSPRLLIASDMRPYLKVKHIKNPLKEGVILNVIEDTPSEARIYVYWLSDDSLDFVNENDLIITGEPTFEEMKKVNEKEQQKVSMLTIQKNPFNWYLSSFLQTFRELPVKYAEFREWAKDIKDYTLFDSLETFLIGTNLVNITPGLTKLNAKKVVYVSSDNATKVIELGEGEEPPEKITDDAGKEYSKIGEKNE